MGMLRALPSVRSAGGQVTTLGGGMPPRLAHRAARRSIRAKSLPSSVPPALWGGTKTPRVLPSVRSAGGQVTTLGGGGQQHLASSAVAGITRTHPLPSSVPHALSASTLTAWAFPSARNALLAVTLPVRVLRSAGGAGG